MPQSAHGLQADAADAIPGEPLEEWEYLALTSNPVLRRMREEADGLWAKTGYVGRLPDPSLGANFFTPPMHFEPDRQLAQIEFMQMIPWLGRLSAESQRACIEAMVAENMFEVERLRVLGDLRATWFRLYVLDKQIETANAEASQLKSLAATANARVGTGNAQPSDVLMATMELSNLQEQLIMIRQQRTAAEAELNRLVGRDAEMPVASPENLDVTLPDWNFELLRQMALEAQPEIAAARLRSEAARLGIEIARLQQRPDITLGAGWMVMDAPGATMPGAGEDSLMLGVSTTLPIRRAKYQAMVSEAARQHGAAHASEEDVIRRTDALLRDLWEQALAAQRTIELYEKTILPQARQIFESDQQALVNNAVTFDRVIRDYRTLLNLELGYHRARGQLAIALARIRQAVGTDVASSGA